MYPGIQVSKYLGFMIFKYPGIQVTWYVFKYPGIQVSRNHDIKVSRY